MVATADTKRFLAADAYATWRRRVKAAERSVRIYSPYLDALAVSLLGNTNLDTDALSVVTDLSPTSGTVSYRSQLLALRRLLELGVEVRSLARLHAKVLLIDCATVTVGSQNFTSYGRNSHETTAAPSADLSDSRFVETLESWYDEAEPVDLELIERLLDDLADPIAEAKRAIDSLVSAYEEVEQGHREGQRTAATRRFERDLARARESSTSEGIRKAAAASAYSAGQSVAFAHLEWLDAGFQTLMRSDPNIDLTRWRMSFGGVTLDTVRLAPLAFYPVLLGPDGRMAFVRVGRSRITYVWRGVRWGAAREIGGRRLFERASFPDDQSDGANLVLTFGWTEGAPNGYELRLRFDGESVLPVAGGELIGDPWNGDQLIDLVESAYEDEEAWNDVLRDTFSPAHNPRGFRNSPNAASYFPTGWLRVDHAKMLNESVLLIQPSQ